MKLLTECTVNQEFYCKSDCGKQNSKDVPHPQDSHLMIIHSISVLPCGQNEDY